MGYSFNDRLKQFCESKNNRLCIGLDIDPDKLIRKSNSRLKDIELLAKDIIDSTITFCPVYKPNMAFYERFGSKGYAIMERIVDYIDGRAITIADGKRGDIGNTTIQYAKAIFDTIGFDSITVSPYMGTDSIKPFIANKSKGAFVLCLTSNPSSIDLQYLNMNSKNYLYENVAELVKDLNIDGNLGLVVGATNSKDMEGLRHKSSGLPWLIPGIGAQGGSLENSISIGNKNDIGIVNISRAIIYAGNGSIEDIVQSAMHYTKKIRELL